MKIRTDFVTNSSSSSFVVAFEKVPQTVEELIEVVFSDNAKEYGCVGHPYSNTVYSISELASTIFQDMHSEVEDWDTSEPNETNPVSPKRVEKEFTKGSIPADLAPQDDPEPDEYIRASKYCWNSSDPKNPKYMKEPTEPGGWDNVDWQKLYADKDEWAARRAREFMAEHKGKSFFIFEYGDDNGDYYSLLEHGDIFENLPHVRISKH